MTPTCPRRGYDLSGHIASWERACPIEGRCSECGLAFAWRQVLVESERVNTRHVEHCRARAIPIATVRTLVWCVLPWVFWKKVRLHHEPRLRRMAIWLALVLICSQVVAGLVTAGALMVEETDAIGQLNKQRQRQIAWLRKRITELEPIESRSALSESQARLLGYARSQLTTMPPPIRPERLVLRSLAKGLAYPLAYVEDEAPAVVRTRLMGNWLSPSLPTPAWRVSLVRFWRNPVLIVGTTLSLAFPLMLLILAGTRRRLNIRLVHLMRGTVFGMAWLMLPAIERVLDMSYGAWQVIEGARGGQLFSRSSTSDWPLWAWGVALWIGAWWLCAIGRGFRFPRPLVHWIMLMIPCAILTLVALGFVFSPLYAFDMLDPPRWRHAEDHGQDASLSMLSWGRVDRVR